MQQHVLDDRIGALTVLHDLVKIACSAETSSRGSMTGFDQFADHICDAPQILRDNAGSFGPWAPLARAMVATIGVSIPRQEPEFGETASGLILRSDHRWVSMILTK